MPGHAKIVSVRRAGEHERMQSENRNDRDEAVAESVVKNSASARDTLARGEHVGSRVPSRLRGHASQDAAKRAQGSPRARRDARRPLRQRQPRVDGNTSGRVQAEVRNEIRRSDSVRSVSTAVRALRRR